MLNERGRKQKLKKIQRVGLSLGFPWREKLPSFSHLIVCLWLKSWSIWDEQLRSSIISRKGGKRKINRLCPGGQGQKGSGKQVRQVCTQLSQPAGQVFPRLICNVLSNHLRMVIQARAICGSSWAQRWSMCAWSQVYEVYASCCYSQSGDLGWAWVLPRLQIPLKYGGSDGGEPFLECGCVKIT